MFNLEKPDEIAWLISTVYLAAFDEDKEEGRAVFHAIMESYVPIIQIARGVN